MSVSRITLMVALLLSLTTGAFAGKKCRSSSQCGTCGFCFAGECQVDPVGLCGPCQECSSKTLKCVRVADGTGCGGCAVCAGGTCTADDSRCPQCQVCNSGTRTCSNGPDGPSPECGGDSCCDGGCTDTKTDTSNCGSCGHVCPAGQECSGGLCFCPGLVPPCPGTGACCNLADGEKCDSTGQCISVCPYGQVWCGGQCLNSPQPDGGHCCEYNGTHHVCADTDECAGPGCCEKDSQPCVFGDSVQCCDAGYQCVQTSDGAAACCIPGTSDPQVCCGSGNCLPSVCCRPN